MLAESIQDDNVEFKRLTQRPLLAWPTLLLWAFSASLWCTSTVLAILGQVDYVFTFLMNGWATFLAFTVLHDASHRSISTHQWVNASLGQLSIIFLSPAPAFSMFRFIHMQHHRFTNEGSAVDPDYWVGQGPKLLLPCKWMIIDIFYYAWYIPRLASRSKKEKREFVITILSLIAVMSVLFYMGWFDEFLLYHFLPARLASFLLAFTFDYLPHHPHAVTAKQAPYQATNVRVGLEWLMTPVLLYQNYHLIHHLHPLVPFYRYIKIWRARQRTLLENESAMVKSLSNRPVSVAEYTK